MRILVWVEIRMGKMDGLFAGSLGPYSSRLVVDSKFTRYNVDGLGPVWVCDRYAAEGLRGCRLWGQEDMICST